LIGAFITVANISLFSNEETRVINFLHLQGNGIRIHSSDSRSNLAPNLEGLFDSASFKEDKHTAANTPSKEKEKNEKETYSAAKQQ
jgi:hypothetical protein